MLLSGFNMVDFIWNYGFIVCGLDFFRCFVKIWISRLFCEIKVDCFVKSKSRYEFGWVSVVVDQLGLVYEWVWGGKKKW